MACTLAVRPHLRIWDKPTATNHQLVQQAPDPLGPWGSTVVKCISDVQMLLDGQGPFHACKPQCILHGGQGSIREALCPSG